ncbi:hypothetical protein B0H14DRAFT_3176822 [Mycena olivaceomarginata]|nr:hypothetical protein B0H14DRAFT_3176822 [Mycena olivaceomarginata]
MLPHTPSWALEQRHWPFMPPTDFSAKLSVSKIQTHLLEARSVKTWGEYLEKVKEILQSIDECAKEVKDIQTSILLTIEAERQRQLCEGIKEVRETIDATICSSMRAFHLFSDVIGKHAYLWISKATNAP